MLPEVEAVESLEQGTRLIAATEQNLRRPDALSDMDTIAVMLEGAGLSFQSIEILEPVASALADQIRAKESRATALKSKIDGLRSLSDDVRTSPAESGTAHRTANNLQTELDEIESEIETVTTAVVRFAAARVRLRKAYAIFSERYETSSAAEPLRATRNHSSTPEPEPEQQRTSTSRAAEDSAAGAPATQPNWLAIAAIAVPVGVLFAPALVPLAYFGPKYVRRPAAHVAQPSKGQSGGLNSSGIILVLGILAAVVGVLLR